jgi:hypothetical protein
MAGTSFGAPHPTIANLYPMFLDNINSNLIVFAYTTTAPDTTASTYSHGCILIRTDGGNLTSSIYQNIGTAASPSWYNIVAS